jgi:hypothetical protein
MLEILHYGLWDALYIYSVRVINSIQTKELRTQMREFRNLNAIELTIDHFIHPWRHVGTRFKARNCISEPGPQEPYSPSNLAYCRIRKHGFKMPCLGSKRQLVFGWGQANLTLVYNAMHLMHRILSNLNFSSWKLCAVNVLLCINHRKVLLKSFPMNGQVNRFDNLKLMVPSESTAQEHSSNIRTNLRVNNYNTSLKHLSNSFT